MKLYINRQYRSGPFGGGNNFVRGFFNHFEAREKAGDKSHVLCMPTDPKANPDAMLIVGLDNDGTGISIDQALMYKMTYNHKLKIVLRVNENDARKGTTDVDDKLIKVSGMIDATVFVSEWLRGYFDDRGWKCKNNTVIVNGVDRDIFKPQEKLNNGKVNIVSHHWSDNRRKSGNITEWLDKDFIAKRKDEYQFTFIGRTQCNLKHSTIVRPLSGQKLGEELGKHDVYFSESLFDPGPNSIIEAVTCELPTYVHSDGGGSVEFAGADHMFKSFNQLEQILLERKFTKNPTHFQSWDSCIDEYVKFMEKV